MSITDNNDVATQSFDSDTVKKRSSIKQLERELKKLELQQAKAKEKLQKQIEKEKEKAIKAQARKSRNHQIYKIGALVPAIFGTAEFDKLIATDSKFIARIAGAIAHLQGCYENSSHDAVIVLDNAYKKGVSILEKNKNRQHSDSNE